MKCITEATLREQSKRGIPLNTGNTLIASLRSTYLLNRDTSIFRSGQTRDTHGHGTVINNTSKDSTIVRVGVIGKGLTNKVIAEQRP